MLLLNELLKTRSPSGETGHIMKFSSTNREHAAAIFSRTGSGKIKLKSDDELVRSLRDLPGDTDFNHYDGRINPILILAAANNRPKTVAYLLHTRKVDVNIQGAEKITALHYATLKGNTAITALLLQNSHIRLDETCRDKYGETPLFKILSHPEIPEKQVFIVVRLLLEYAPKLANIVNEDGLPPIAFAAVRKAPRLVRLLLGKDAEVSKKCRDFLFSEMMKNSITVPLPRTSPGITLFSVTTPEMSALRDCVNQVVDAYNKQHLLEDLAATASAASGPKP